MKARRVIMWILLVLAAGQFICVGAAKSAGVEAMMKGFRELNYTDGFGRFIGVCELLGGIGLLLSRTRLWAALGLMIIMVGAVGSHLGAGQAPDTTVPAAVSFFMLLGILALDDSFKLVLNPKTKET